jgi:hypothetical protein
VSDRQIDNVKQWAKDNDVSPDATTAVALPPVAKGLANLIKPVTDDPNELLRHRYLCRGGGLLLVGPTGIGKSSLAMQAKILWAIGKPMFGIQPVKPLKSLLIQAENDEGDLAEMRDGVMAGLDLTAEERQMAMETIVVTREDGRTGFAFLEGAVHPLLEEYKPDLLWIDPALAYLGGEVSSQKDVGGFLRNMLNPLLREFNCGAVVVHHTNKPPPGREKPDWAAGDFAYLGGGSAEWGNWARAVLALRSLGSHSVFELRAGKRGERLRWKEADGETKSYFKLIAHAKEPGVICWREADPENIPDPANGRRIPTEDDIMVHVPLDKPIAKDALRSKANAAGIALNRINPLIAELLEEGRLFEWRIRRSGTNPQKLLARTPAPSE